MPNLVSIYEKLFSAFGHQNWWPGETDDEIAIGAILTQNTAWKNVEKAIQNLKQVNLCSFSAIFSAEEEKIKKLISPAGFFNSKTQYLKNFAFWLNHKKGFSQLKKCSCEELRLELLSIKGIGKETADSILLYVFSCPFFVVDAYTKRLVHRRKIISAFSYDEIQKLFMENIPLDIELYKNYHALIVELGKTYCKRNPRCDVCPLKEFL
ncbi:MAG: endonuclease III domain-containing protein [Campylobacterota bacterium]|nr:endonuclease III domain-containing protein [Campylobacterota bacterium]